MTEQDRAALTAQVLTDGQELNKLREYALKTEAPFVAGILRGAEESLKLAYDMLSDETVADKDL